MSEFEIGSVGASFASLEHATENRRQIIQEVRMGHSLAPADGSVNADPTERDAATPDRLSGHALFETRHVAGRDGPAGGAGVEG